VSFGTISENEQQVAANKCMFCDKQAVSALVFYLNVDQSQKKFVSEKRWFYCQEHGDRISGGLNLYFAELMARSEERVPIK
jgi:hypothetical protein